MAGMQAAEPFRDQHLGPLPDQFGAVIPEQGLHLRVDELDQAGLVHDHHGVRRRFKQPAEPPLGDIARDYPLHRFTHAFPPAVAAVRRVAPHATR
jgi:hypothetical protein